MLVWFSTTSKQLLNLIHVQTGVQTIIPRFPVQDVTRQQFETLILGPIPTWWNYIGLGTGGGGRGAESLNILSGGAGVSFTLEISLICILLLASRDVHFWQKNDMLLKWTIVKSTAEPKPREACHLKDTWLYVIFKSSLYVLLWYAFMNRLTV